MEFLSIDRIENGIAVCEDDNRNRVEIPLEKIEGTPKEGDLLVPENGGYVVDVEETAHRRETVLRLQRKLFGKE